nr:hypothetical protein [Bacteroides intestinalis]
MKNEELKYSAASSSSVYRGGGSEADGGVAFGAMSSPESQLPHRRQLPRQPAAARGCVKSKNHYHFALSS